MDLPVRIGVNDCARASTGGGWRVEWRLTNLLREPLSLQDAWVPHGRFRGEGHVALQASIPPAGEYLLTLAVRAEEPHGTVVKNAFLILQVHTSTLAWRVFARMRVTFGDVPVPEVEAVTAQPL